MTYETPSEITSIAKALVTPAAICFVGMTFFWSLPAKAETFACASARTAAEFAICNDENLLVLDEKLEKTFNASFTTAPTVPQRQALARQHSQWTAKRNACGADFTCLKLRYDERLSTLKNNS